MELTSETHLSDSKANNVIRKIQKRGTASLRMAKARLAGHIRRT